MISRRNNVSLLKITFLLAHSILQFLTRLGHFGQGSSAHKKYKYIQAHQVKRDLLKDCKNRCKKIFQSHNSLIIQKLKLWQKTRTSVSQNKKIPTFLHICSSLYSHTNQLSYGIHLHTVIMTCSTGKLQTYQFCSSEVIQKSLSFINLILKQ